MQKGFLVHNRQYGNKISSDMSYLKRLTSVLAPVKFASRTFTGVHYGGSNKQFLGILISPKDDGLQFTNGSVTLKSKLNEYFEPEDTKIWPPYDPTTRPWYKSGKEATYPNYAWSDVFINQFLGCISIAASTKLNFDMFNESGALVTEVVGSMYDLYHIDSLLQQTVDANIDMQTISIEILLVERSGMLLASSIFAPTLVNSTRLHMSSTGPHFSNVANYLENAGVLNEEGNLPKKRTDPTHIVFFQDGNRVAVDTIKDNNLDWVLIVSTKEYGYIKTILAGSPLLLCASVLLMILGSIFMIIITHLLTRALFTVARNMYQMSKLQIQDVKPNKRLKLVYDMDLLQQSTRAVKQELDSFMKYIPKDIVRDIVQSGQCAKLGMSGIETSILFTDIADFTAMSETVPISVLIKVLSSYFAIVTQSVESNGGVIDKFIGDGTMSLFSHPLRPLPNHALCACRAAIQAQSDIEKLKLKSLQEGWPIVCMRVGINTGTAMIGNIGHTERFNYTAIGDCVNVAGRLEVLNKRYNSAILIGQATFESASKEFVCYFVDTVKLKGKDKPTNVYTIANDWLHATEHQKLIYNQLLTVRDLMREGKYLEQNAMLVEIVNLVEMRKLEEYQNLKSNEGLSNLKFIFDLLSRSDNLIEKSQQGNAIDYSLSLKEK